MSRTLIDECKDGNVDGAKQMILNGENVNMIDSDDDNDDVTPLYIASENGHLEIVKVLIASGALLDKANNYGKTQLYKATKKDKKENNYRSVGNN